MSELLPQIGERKPRPALRDRVCACCGHPLPAPEPDEVLRFADLHLDVPRHLLTIDGHPAQWGDRPSIQPCLMLGELMRWPGRVWRRDALMAVLGMWEVQPKILDVLAYRIRRALMPSRARLHTVKCTGFVLEADQ